MRLAPHLIAPVAFALAAALAGFVAIRAADAIERWSTGAVTDQLAVAGHDWAEVSADGLRVRLSGTAPTEAERFSALTLAGDVIDAGRITDAMNVVETEAPAPPDYAVEILRNDSGVTLIGLVPETTDRGDLARRLETAAAGGAVADMLETASHPVPEGWTDALAFGLEALADLPRAKVSIGAGRVSVTAVADSQDEKRRLESVLARRRPAEVILSVDISAPRPVIAPFTLRFVIDERGARFDACAADTERARAQILAAAAAAGLEGKSDCTLGLGVPTPDWATAVGMALRALGDLGAGTVTFKDADVALLVPASVSPEAFDRAVGALESNLPEVIALTARREEQAETGTRAGAPPVFAARLTEQGQVDLSGRLTDELTREAVENFARSRFGNAAVYAAARLDPTLPKGWSVRVLAGIEALAELEVGTLTVTAERLEIGGLSGDRSAGDRVARILALRLGEDAPVSIAVRYDPSRDPELLKPTPEDCIGRVQAILDDGKISFEPGSATITRSGAPTLDRIAEVLRDCPDVPMQVAGHTDSQGRAEMNLALSESRAQSVVMALLDRRVLTGSLVAKGYGETRPVADNDTEEGREANRRIEFTLLSAIGPALPGDTPEPAAPRPAEAEPASPETGPETGAGPAPSEAGSAASAEVAAEPAETGPDEAAEAPAPGDGPPDAGAEAGDAPAGAPDAVPEPAAEAPQAVADNAEAAAADAADPAREEAEAGEPAPPEAAPAEAAPPEPAPDDAAATAAAQPGAEPGPVDPVADDAAERPAEATDAAGAAPPDAQAAAPDDAAPDDAEAPDAPEPPALTPRPRPESLAVATAALPDPAEAAPAAPDPAMPADAAPEDAVPEDAAPDLAEPAAETDAETDATEPPAETPAAPLTDTGVPPAVPVALAGEDTPRPRAVPDSVLKAAADRARRIAAELAAAALARTAPEGVDLRPATEDTPRPRPRPERPGTETSEGDDRP
ncbi:MAG: OmpA family protein [Rhodobacteraceae bacterium]|nr:OmpA family protein [Paracoccaceae bacterium]